MINKDILKNRYNNLSSINSGYFECQLQVLDETDKAICFNTYNGHLDKEKRVWIAKSQIEILDLGSDAGVRYFIKNWLYSKLK